MRECSACGNEYTKASGRFSKTQWLKGDGLTRCKTCVSAEGGCARTLVRPAVGRAMEEPSPLPDAFIDPFTEEPFVDPVVTGDGHTYSRGPIEDWFRRNPLNPTSPKTNEPLGTTALVSNITVRQAIEEMRARQPMALDPSRLRMREPEELLGEGSYGRVVAGTLTLGRAKEVQVAVKKLPAMTMEAERTTFQRELKALMHAARHCDGICVLYGTCELDSRVCLVMKRYERSLREVIVQAGGLAAAEVRRNSHTLFRVLGQLHDSELVVRDIKPDNILVDAFGDLVFSDFGISEVMLTSTHVEQSQMKGTSAYMAPEAFNDSKVGPPVDIWAMACVVLEMHTGAAPWRGLKMQQIWKAVAQDRRIPDIPAEAPSGDVLRRCFAFAPAERPPAAELARAFAPTFEAVAGAPVVARLEASQERCLELEAAKLELEQQLARLRQELQAQEDITQQLTNALTDKTAEARRRWDKAKAAEDKAKAAEDKAKAAEDKAKAAEYKVKAAEDKVKAAEDKAKAAAFAVFFVVFFVSSFLARQKPSPCSSPCSSFLACKLSRLLGRL